MEIYQLLEIEKNSQSRGIPIIGPKKGKWLLNKIKKVKPKKVLELGTAVGYSGIILGSEGAELITIDTNAKEAEEAMINFSQFKTNAQIVIGDAVHLVEEMVKDKTNWSSFNLVFIDFAMMCYLDVLENCIKMVKRGGLIIADNVNKEVNKDTGIKSCQQFKEAILNHPRLKTEIIEIEDGMSCSVKI